MVIPAYQARRTIGAVVAGVRRMGLPVTVVDDASTDGTAAEAEAAGARVIRRGKNGGKGAALREGLTDALKSGFLWVVLMDADGQHLPEEIPKFLRRKGEADLVIGNRMEDPRGMPWERRLTNRLMSRLLSRKAGQPVPDSQCGFRLLSRRLMETVPLNSDHFEIDSELVLRSAWAGFQITSVPVRSVYRRQMSFIQPLRDTVRFFRFLRRVRRERPEAAA